jgi:membrane-bound inhibitor of C-type lysozyme
MRNLPRSHTREQAPRSGVLELELADVEKLDKIKWGTTTLRAECKHDKSVTAAYWDPRGRSIVSTSYDDILRRTSPFAE